MVTVRVSLVPPDDGLPTTGSVSGECSMGTSCSYSAESLVAGQAPKPPPRPEVTAPQAGAVNVSVASGVKAVTNWRGTP